MHALPLIIGVICVFVIAYRFYGAFLAAKVLALDDSRETPAYRLNDGNNYHPTNKWVLFGHHFAAITGAGPLIGPVLAAQFGFLPGLLWLVIGVVLGGAVHDFIILTASIRHDGKSLAEIAKQQLSPFAGVVTGIAIIFIIIIALAGLGFVVVKALGESAWGTFTIGVTIPLAFFMGLWMYKFRKGKIVEGTVIGVIGLIAATVLGKYVPGSSWAPYFTLSETSLTYSIAAYGFIASVLPVWMLLCPRDYLSSYMKIGVIALLAIGIIWVNPEIHMPAVTEYVHGGGPIVKGKLFPFVFITIACGAISGFHSLVASGTTPKMITRESHALPIGYGAMLIESLVGVTALIAASSLFPADYFAINMPPADFAHLHMETVNIDELARQVGEQVRGRTGGAVSLALGMAQIFSKLPGMNHLIDYWYHFCIMFEAMFILTTIDTGTRVARFVVQEFIGKAIPAFARTDWIPGTLISTALVVVGWAYFILTGSIQTIWPMFGIANQLLAVVALCVATMWLINTGKGKYKWVTLTPMIFVAITTLTAGYQSIRDIFLPMTRIPEKSFQGWLDITLTIAVMSMAAIMVGHFLMKMKERKSLQRL